MRLTRLQGPFYIVGISANSFQRKKKIKKLPFKPSGLRRSTTQVPTTPARSRASSHPPSVTQSQSSTSHSRHSSISTIPDFDGPLLNEYAGFEEEDEEKAQEEREQVEITRKRGRTTGTSTVSTERSH